MTTIGYARVSTADQNPQAQVDALTAAGCEKVFQEHASGVLSQRPQLDACLGYLREGDTLVITRLDRLGRSMKHLKAIVDELEARKVTFRVVEQQIDTSSSGGRLFFHILAGFAEFEHDMIVERTRDGLAAARARGRKGGRKPKMTPAKIKAAQSMYRAKNPDGSATYSISEIAQVLGVSRATIYDHLAPGPADRAEAEPA